MSPASQPWSRSFLVVWVALPLAIVLGSVLRLHDFDPMLAVSFASLALAGLWLPSQYRAVANAPAWPLGLLLLFLAPSWVGASKLSNADWRGSVALTVVALWMAIPWALSRWQGGDALSRLRGLSLLFVALAALPPLLSFLSRNFGGADWPALAALSPFVTLAQLRLEGGGAWKQGLIVSGIFLGLAWVRARATQEIS